MSKQLLTQKHFDDIEKCPNCGSKRIQSFFNYCDQCGYLLKYNKYENEKYGGFV